MSAARRDFTRPGSGYLRKTPRAVREAWLKVGSRGADLSPGLTCALYLYLLPVLQRSFEPDIGDGMFGEMLQHLQEERDHASNNLRRFPQVDGMPGAGLERLGFEVVVVVDLT